jgi:hypothetical protein
MFDALAHVFAHRAIRFELVIFLTAAFGALRLNGEASGLDLTDLVFGGLVGGADAATSEDATHLS